MKKTYLLPLVTMTATVLNLVSCSQKDTPLTDKVAVKFSSGIITMTPASRAAGMTWNANDAIGVYMLEAGSKVVVDGMANKEYVATTGGVTGKFEANGDIIYFPDNGKQVRFMSYYPYDDNMTESNVYKVNISNQDPQAEIDLLYSFNEEILFEKTTVTNKTVPLVFKHKLTKVYIKVKAGEGLENDDLDDIEVHFSGLNTQANFDLMTGELKSPSVNDVDITPVRIADEGDHVACYEAIILPMADPIGEIVFDLNNGVGENESDVFTWAFDKELKSSVKYLYNVTINRSGLIVEATIVDWTEVDTEDISAE